MELLEFSLEGSGGERHVPVGVYPEGTDILLEFAGLPEAFYSRLFCNDSMVIDFAPRFRSGRVLITIGSRVVVVKER